MLKAAGYIMNKKPQQLLEHIIPFIVLGIVIALSITLFIIFTYVLLWGLVIGGVLWLIMFIKNYFFAKPAAKNTEGRIIDHHDESKK